MADTKGSALILLVEGAEEMEAVIAADVLRRGKVKIDAILYQETFSRALVKPLGQRSGAVTCKLSCSCLAAISVH